jgi:Cullin family
MWHTGLGGAEVRARFRGEKVHDLSMSTLGCVVLLLFEEVGEGERVGYEVSGVVAFVFRNSCLAWRWRWRCSFLFLCLLRFPYFCFVLPPLRLCVHDSRFHFSSSFTFDVSNNTDLTSTTQEIRTATDLPDAELKRTLQSLACAKYKVLKKHPPSRDVASTDAFSFNLDFRAPLQKVRISTVAGRVESGAERQETRDRVEEERRHQIEVGFVSSVACVSRDGFLFWRGSGTVLSRVIFSSKCVALGRFCTIFRLIRDFLGP